MNQQLPKEIGQFTSLTSLDFSYNKDITSLPDELGRCSKIYEVKNLLFYFIFTFLLTLNEN